MKSRAEVFFEVAHVTECKLVHIADPEDICCFVNRKQQNCLNTVIVGSMLSTLTLRWVVFDLRSLSALRGKMAWLLVTAFLERCSATTSVLRCLMAFNVFFCSAVKPSSPTSTARPCTSACPTEHKLNIRECSHDFAGRLHLHAQVLCTCHALSKTAACIILANQANHVRHEH